MACNGAPTTFCWSPMTSRAAAWAPITRKRMRWCHWPARPMARARRPRNRCRCYWSAVVLQRDAGRVVDKGVLAAKAHQLHARLAGDADRQRTGGRDSRQQGNLHAGGLARQLVTATAGQEHETAPHVDAIQCQVADQFIEPVMAADIFEGVQNRP